MPDPLRNDEGHLAVAFGVSVGRTEGFLRSFALVGLDSGGGIRTRDLRVMSPTSYQTAPPRGGPLILAAVGGIGEKNAARGRVRTRARRGAGGVPAGHAGTSFEARTSAIEPASCSRTLDIAAISAAAATASASRSLKRWILPVAVRGKSSTNASTWGYS